ncbi:MAG: membrane protein insertion efficiency factor YidD [Candidatus Lambdaproteobacteria bacterium]|nr:membrane protein insertion efficiency factor YidD [Candidatus Lambdaproteobacteria bacterium]
MSLAQGLLSTYRNVVSPVDGDRCDMAPSCSLYSRQALRRHGVLLGVLLTADRLLHEADEQVRVAPVRIGGELAYPDPLEHNTYWLPGWLGGPAVPPPAEGVDPGAAPTAPSDQVRAELPRAGERVVPERAGK